MAEGGDESLEGGLRRVTVRPMREADVPSVAAVAQAAAEDGWTEAAFDTELRNPLARCDVATDPSGGTMGYIVSWIVADEAQVLDVAVQAAARRKGCGAALVTRTLEHARAAGCRSAHLEVRRSNVAAIALYERYGFRTVAVRNRYYARGDEDALVMRLDLDA